MSEKRTVLEPASREEMDLPPLAERRALLQLARDGFRRDGYGHFMLRIALEAQKPGNAKEAGELQEKMADLRASEANAYAAARRLEEELDALPAEEGA